MIFQAKGEVNLTLSVRETAKLNRIIKLAEQLVANGKPQHINGKKRIRRTGRELIRFRKMLKAERRKGVPATVLARQHGISTAYIYSLR
jgi:hypothetical protein